MLAEGAAHVEQLLSGSIAVRTTCIALHLRVIEKVLLAVIGRHYIRLQLLSLGMFVESFGDVFPIRARLKLAACQFLGLLIDLWLELMAWVVLALVGHGALSAIRFEQ